MSQAIVAASNQQYAVSDMERMARAVAGSKLFGIQNPEQALALCLVAQAEGRHPASAAQDYHIIQGRPSKKADAMLRDFLTGGGKVSDWHLTDERVAATFSHPAGGTVTIDWDMARAKKAGITNPMWNKYPRQMLRARVVSEGVRTVFPMATSGMYVPEEVVDFTPPATTTNEQSQVIDAEFTETDRPEAPQAKTLVKDQRPLWKEMADEIDACQSEEQVRTLWASRPFQTELKKIKPDWQRDLRVHRDDHIRILNGEQPTNEEAPAEFVPPNFDAVEQEGVFT